MADQTFFVSPPLFADWETCAALSHQRSEEQHRISAPRTREPHTQDRPYREKVAWPIVLKIGPCFQTGAPRPPEMILMMPHDRGETPPPTSVSHLFVLVFQALRREEEFGAKVLRRHERVPDPSLNRGSPRVKPHEFHSLISW